MVAILAFSSKIGCFGCAAWWGTDKTQKYYQSHYHTVAGPLISKADELPVHNRKGLGNHQKEKGGGGTLNLEEALSAHWATLCGCLGFLTFYTTKILYKCCDRSLIFDGKKSFFRF
jgi:hypothetical protein